MRIISVTSELCLESGRECVNNFKTVSAAWAPEANIAFVKDLMKFTFCDASVRTLFTTLNFEIVKVYFLLLDKNSSYP